MSPELTPEAAQAVLLERTAVIAQHIAEIRDHLKTQNGRIRKIEDAYLVMETKQAEVQRSATVSAQKWGAGIATVVSGTAALLKALFWN